VHACSVRSLRIERFVSRRRASGTWPAWTIAHSALLAGFLCLNAAPALSVSAAQPPRIAEHTVEVKTEQMHQLDVVPVESRPFRQRKSAIGQIAFNEDASTTVLTPFSGRVTRLIAKVGDHVKRGDPLFEVDSPEVAQAQTELIAAVHALGKAKSHLALTKRVLDRQRALLKDKATAQREVDQADAEHDAARSDYLTAEGSLAAARNRLRVIIGRGNGEIERIERERIVNPLITVHAPIDGTVTARKVGPGQYVRSDAGETLYALSDLSTMWLKAHVPEADIAAIQVGQEVEVKVAAFPNRTFAARITAVGAASDQATRRVVVRSEIPNPDGALKAEMFATFKISVGEPEVTPAVPTEAIIRDGALAAVWVRRAEHTFQRRPVQLGYEQSGLVQVQQGVRAGEFVVGRGAIFVDNEWRQ